MKKNFVFSAALTSLFLSCGRQEESKLPYASHVKIAFDGNGSLLFKGVQNADIPSLNVYRLSYKDAYFLPQLEKEGAIILKRDAHEAVLQLPSLKAAERIATLAHDLSGASCGALTLVSDEENASVANSSFLPLTASDERETKIKNLISQVKAGNVEATVKKLSSFENRYYTAPTGVEAAKWVAGKEGGYGTHLKAETKAEVSLFDHGARWPQNSVVARIPGTKSPEKIVVIGSHLDSINQFFMSRAPGADDNATGTSSLIELFRILQENGVAFENTVELHSYAAEELGLLGSADMAKKYKQQGKQIVAMMQLDMTAFLKPGNQQKIWLVSNGTDAKLNTLLGSLIDRYVGLPWGQKKLTAGTSDHQSWAKQGFTVAFPTEDPEAFNTSIHTTGDVMDKLNFEFAKNYVSLAIAFLGEVAGI